MTLAAKDGERYSLRAHLYSQRAYEASRDARALGDGKADWFSHAAERNRFAARYHAKIGRAANALAHTRAADSFRSLASAARKSCGSPRFPTKG